MYFVCVVCVRVRTVCVFVCVRICAGVYHSVPVSVSVPVSGPFECEWAVGAVQIVAFIRRLHRESRSLLHSVPTSLPLWLCGLTQK